MDPSALPGYLEAIVARVAEAAVPVAGAMAKTYEKHVRDVTLTESGGHQPVTYTPAPAGRPPAIMTNRLRASIEMAGPVGGGGFGEASVAPHTIYACVQEWGGVHYAAPGRYMWLWLKYIGYEGMGSVTDRGLLRRVVRIPERPYMRTAVAETIASGELQDAAEGAFEAAVWGG